MPDKDMKYTQVIDEKTGEIKYVPENPPTPPPASAPGKGDQDGKKTPYTAQDRAMKTVFEALQFPEVDDLAAVLQGLEDNNKKLRYNKRLQSGKLDGSRLTSYKTSDRLFKKKAIKHKDYQFTILVDTSGSMFSGEDNTSYNNQTHEWQNSKIKVSIESTLTTVRALEQLKIPVSVIGMNGETRLIKGFDEEYDKDTMLERFDKNIIGENDDEANMGGTAEGVAYRETTKYIEKNTKTPKTENVIFVLSDGAPGWSESNIAIAMDSQEAYLVENTRDDRDANHTTALKSYWERSPYKAYGIGIMSNADQIPRSKRLDDLATLPVFMADLIQEIML